MSVYPLRRSFGVKTPEDAILTACPRGKHIIHLSRNWAETLKNALVGSFTELGERCGVTPGRVGQIVRLSGLAPEIIAFLAALEGKKALRGYSEKRIRSIVPLPAQKQIEAFERRFGLKLPSGIDSFDSAL